MANLLTEVTDLRRFRRPTVEEAAIQVAAAQDGFLPGAGQVLHSHWPDSQLRWFVLDESSPYTYSLSLSTGTDMQLYLFLFLFSWVCLCTNRIKEQGHILGFIVGSMSPFRHAIVDSFCKLATNSNKSTE